MKTQGQVGSNRQGLQIDLPHNFHLATASNVKHRQYQYSLVDQRCRLASLEDLDEALSPTYATYKYFKILLALLARRVPFLLIAQ